MKKLLALLLAVIMVFGLVACAKDAADDGAADDGAAAKTLTAQQTGTKRSRLGKYLWLLFPDKAIMHNKYPSLQRYPFLLPVFWIHRIFYTLFCTRGKIVEQNQVINAGSESNADQFRSHMEAVGLDVLKGRKDS